MTTFTASNFANWWVLFEHYLLMSLLSIGGALTILPDMHRFLVLEQHWVTESQFSASIAIAQGAPGPNMLAVVLLAFNVGVYSGGVAVGLIAAVVALVGILLPSLTLTYIVSKWLRQHMDKLSVQAFKQGLAPITSALVISVGWIMLNAYPSDKWHLWGVAAITIWLVLYTRIHLFFLISAGALLGFLGVV